MTHDEIDKLSNASSESSVQKSLEDTHTTFKKPLPLRHWKKTILLHTGEDIPESSNNYISIILKNNAHLYEGECEDCVDDFTKKFVKAHDEYIVLRKGKLTNIITFFKEVAPSCKHKPKHTNPLWNLLSQLKKLMCF